MDIVHFLQTERFKFGITHIAYQACIDGMLAEGYDGYTVSSQKCLELMAFNFLERFDPDQVEKEIRGPTCPVWDYYPGGVPLAIVGFYHEEDGCCLGVVHRNELTETYAPPVHDGQHKRKIDA